MFPELCRFLSSLTACISSNASLTARNIKLDKLPAIMLVGKSRQLGSNCEVLSVIHGRSRGESFKLLVFYILLFFFPGNIGLDDLLTRLIDTCDMFEEQLQVEIRQEDERAARDQVKAEQDMAYEMTLQADMAKDAAKRQKEAAQLAERKRMESERAEEDARRESIRLVVSYGFLPSILRHSFIRICFPLGSTIATSGAVRAGGGHFQDSRAQAHRRFPGASLLRQQ